MRIVDIYLVYSFLRRLATPFDKWDAFRLGIIDKDGNILRKQKDLRTSDERKAFGYFDILVLNIKKLLGKLPGGSSRLASYAAALFLIREGREFEGVDLSEDILQQGLDYYIDLLEDRDVNGELLELFDKPMSFKVEKDTPGLFTASAKIENETLGFMGQENGPNSYDIMFVIDGQMDITGSGNSNKIFSTVFAILKEFIKRKKPDNIVFSGEKDKGKGRSSLYGKMIKRYAPSLGYKFSEREVGNSTMFSLSKKNVKEDMSVPTNSVGSGAIAGLGVGPDGEPGLTKKQQKKHKKRVFLLRRTK
jgi:hypothetical protein